MAVSSNCVIEKWQYVMRTWPVKLEKVKEKYKYKGRIYIDAQTLARCEWTVYRQEQLQNLTGLCTNLALIPPWK